MTSSSHLEQNSFLNNYGIALYNTPTASAQEIVHLSLGLLPHTTAGAMHEVLSNTKLARHHQSDWGERSSRRKLRHRRDCRRRQSTVTQEPSVGSAAGGRGSGGFQMQLPYYSRDMLKSVRLIRA